MPLCLQTTLFLFCNSVVFCQRSLFSRLAVVNVVALCRCQHFFKISDARLHQEVIPLQQFLDVAVVNAVFIEIRKHLVKVGAQFCCVCCSLVQRAFLSFFLFANAVEDFPKWNVFFGCIDGNVAQTGYTIGCKGWNALVRFVQCFNNQVHFSS